ncbi:MAG: phosphotransferase [Micropruina sp.]|nr:phosphotransferase [Micropruina sp.]
MWLAPVAGASLADLSFAGDASGITAGFAALGTTLAQLHRTSLPAQAPRLRPPWPLLDLLPPHMDSAKHHAVPTLVIETARSWPDVMAAAAQAWRATAWTHGDVSAMNVILASGRFGAPDRLGVGWRRGSVLGSRGRADAGGRPPARPGRDRHGAAAARLPGGWRTRGRTEPGPALRTDPVRGLSSGRRRLHRRSAAGLRRQRHEAAERRGAARGHPPESPCSPLSTKTPSEPPTRRGAPSA